MSSKIAILLSILFTIALCQNFDKYISKHNKKYENDYERNFRYQLYQKTWAMINDANSQNLSYKMGENKFTDRTEE
jgi:hypothetical protein